MQPDLPVKVGKRWKRNRTICLIVLLFVFLFCPCTGTSLAGISGPEQIVLTWAQNPAFSQTITWLAPDNVLSAVQYAIAEGFDGNFDNARTINVNGKRFAGGDQYRYSVTLSGLNPDTDYIYRAGREGAWSEPLSFSTCSRSEDFSFLYLGDVQNGYADWGVLLQEIYEENPHIKFALLGGDLTDNKGNNLAEWGEFLGAAAGVFSRIPMMPARGNHDGDLFEEFFALPGNGPRGINETFYSFDYGDAHFVVLDTSNIITESVKQWLAEDLQGSDKRWKFAVFHKPAYPVVHDNKGIDVAIRENWVPLLEASGVDMVFVGHQHVYMRTHPIYQGMVQTDSYGIVYVMGNSGSKRYAKGGYFPYKAVEEEGSNYQVIELKEDILTLTSRRASGELIETFMLSKKSETAPERPTYKIAPKADAAYTLGNTEDGIHTMTVNVGMAGLKYFAAAITPEVAHSGDETAIFTLLRKGAQINLSATRADFDLVHEAQAGFNVLPGDIIKIYLVDELSNAPEYNPVILH